MTEHDETAERILMGAARQAGYMPRHWPDGSVGFVGPAKVGQLMEAIHHGIVAALAGAQPAAPALDAKDVLPLVRAALHWRDASWCVAGHEALAAVIDALTPAWREAAKGGGR